MSKSEPEVLKVVLDIAEEILGGRPDPSAVMLETELQSLEIAGILVEAEDELGLRVDEGDVDWSGVRTFAEFAAVIARAPSS